MQKLPETVIAAREVANAQSDALHRAWKILNSTENPELQDLENWLEIKNNFVFAQENFERLLQEYLASGVKA